jgi:hypothetical protein
MKKSVFDENCAVKEVLWVGKMTVKMSVEIICEFEYYTVFAVYANDKFSGMLTVNLAE